MCGIAGIWKLDGEDMNTKALERFTDSLLHRGPDGSGYYIDEKAKLGLGHRRLSILDITDRGKQPMNFADKRYWITYNGEIYNFLELREELKKRGYNFISDSDTEVILASYHCWGKDCLHKFNGMWSFAIWDSQVRRLFLARDRFGIKPLYYLHLPKKLFAFASETLAFKYLDFFKREIDEPNLSSALKNPTLLEGIGYTIFKNIFQILPGHYIELKNDEAVQQKRWWNTLEHLYKIPESYEVQVERFRSLFEDACKIRMRSDVPIATALSGGIDSSSVYCMIHHLMKKNFDKIRIPANWQQAFITTFPDTTVDERKYAEQVINYTNGCATFIVPDYSKLITKIIESTKLFDSITTTPIIAATDIYKGMHNSGIKVSLDGHGADEMLFGYTHLVYSAYNSVIEEKNDEYAKDILETYKNMFPDKDQERAIQNVLISNSNLKNETKKNFDRKFYSKFLNNFYRRFFYNRKKINNSASKKWLLNTSYTNLPSLSDRHNTFENISKVDLALYKDFHLTILPSILRNFDRASMQSSIEVRMPFMDWRLVTFIFSLPLKSRIGGGFTKRILRDSMKDIMPESIRKRKLKIGLNAPMIEWFSGEMKDFILDEVSSKSFLESNIWNGNELRNFAEERIRNRSWNERDCGKFWSFINANIILNHR